MTAMLASVTTAAEADFALAAGVDLIDLKDPQSGALGALPLATVRAIVQGFGDRATLSATAGDLAPVPATVAPAVQALAATGVHYVKVGLFPGPRQRDCLAALAPLAAAGTRLVVVLLADRAPDLTLLPVIRAAGCAGVMLDTADKRQGRLTDHIDHGCLQQFVEQARALGLLSGLAGSLRLADIARLLPLAPDYLGFRGALCRGARDGQIEPGALAAVRAAIPQRQALPA